jgi:hypothetical protein
MSVKGALSAIPAGLREPLLAEYQSIVQNFAEHRWSPSELSGGKFCEIVFTILDGFARSAYPAKPAKPRNFIEACRRLEAHGHVPRSFQILIPRILPALYEVRNNRGVGHAGGDVDPNHMDAVFVLHSCNWLMAELVRVFHSVSVHEAQSIVDELVERRTPLLWIGDGMRRVLDPKLSLQEQVLLLLCTSPGKISTADLLKWTGYSNASYFKKLLLQMHKQRLIELSADSGGGALILPPGDKLASELIAKHNHAGLS